MARRSRDEEKPDAMPAAQENGMQNEYEGEQPLAQTAAAATDDQEIGDEEATEEEEIGPDNPDDYNPIMWPAKTKIRVYAGRVRQFAAKDESKPTFGEKFCSVEFVARDDFQESEELYELAGQTFEVIYPLKRGRNSEYQQFVMAAFGELRKFKASEVTNKCFVITVRHGKKKSKETGKQVPAMFIDKIHIDKSVEA